MDAKLLHALLECETDIDGAIKRFSGDEFLYIACLRAFREDSTLKQLKIAIEGKDWDSAFTAAHALKGLCANMGFVPLYHASGNLVVLIREGKIKELPYSLAIVEKAYKGIVSAIMSVLCTENDSSKGEQK